MPRPPTDHYYREKIFFFAEQGYRPPTIARLISEEAEKDGRVDSPSEQTVRRIYQEHMAGDPRDRAQYAVFRWPESMEEAGLPWESSAVILDFLGSEFGVDLHPTLRYTKWYWRVHVAAPDLEIFDKRYAAATLSENEKPTHHIQYRQALVRAVESYLAYAPWRADEDALDEVLYKLFKTNNMLEQVPTLEALGPHDRPTLIAFMAAFHSSSLGLKDETSPYSSLRNQIEARNEELANI